jgi:release factor glutamine methyltransferase
MNVAEALAYGASQLEAGKIENARRDAQLLLSNAIDRDTAFLIAHPEYELTNDETLQFTFYLDRRADREPLQYIIGKQEFYGLEFEVTPDVLIPRPETEILVEAAIKRFAKHNELRFLEIGVGSGCISVSILKNLPRAEAIGVDISNAALEIARRNADRHHVTERLTLICSDVYAKLNESHFDLIVSNPPYIPTRRYRSSRAGSSPVRTANRSRRRC